MTAETDTNPALVAAREADAAVSQCLRDGKHFLLEAGAGAGKTYSLIESLRFLIEPFLTEEPFQGPRDAEHPSR